jgi:hypothetical protein
MTLGADGIARKQAAEDQINLDFARVLGTDAGRRVAAYLRSITLLHVLGPAASDAELRDMEGRRYLVGLMERRVYLGSQADAAGGVRAGGDHGERARSDRRPRGRPIRPAGGGGAA